MSAGNGGRVGLFARRGPEVLPASRDGAGDEGTGSDMESAGEADHVVASSEDHRDQQRRRYELDEDLRQPGLVPELPGPDWHKKSVRSPMAPNGRGFFAGDVVSMGAILININKGKFVS